MPGNELEGRIHNYSRQSQVVDGNWPGFVYNQWQEKQRENSEPLDFNQTNSITQLDSVRGHGNGSLNVSFDQDYRLTQRPGLSSNLPRHQHLKTNDYILGRDILQASQNQVQFLGESTGFVPHNLALRSLYIPNSEQENASGDSPTLTTNSERSEITEASTEINFVGRQQQFARGQQGISPHRSMQQSGYNEMQLLQQHLMFKQLQELQRQQQLQQFGDSRQHNSVNQLSAVAKQAAGVQFSPLINGTPVNDTPQMLMNWVQRGASPTGQNVSNKVSFSPEQGQTLRSMGQAPQQFDVSLYGTPISSGKGTMSQYSHLQSTPQDSVNLLTKANQVQKPAVQASAFSNSFVDDHCTAPDQVFLPQGAFVSKQGFQGKNMFGQATVRGLNCGSTLGSLQQENALQTNTSLHEVNGKQERDGWPGISHSNTMQHGSSQGLVPLDPMEEKILYNTDDSLWDPSLVNCNDIGGGGLGSWSALMQSAVADSSSDTGLHEEWSGLSFQNTELSSGNQPSTILDSEKQQGNWVDNNLHTASSYGSKPFPMLNDSIVNSPFPGFQQPGIQYKPEHTESFQRDESHESIQKSPRSNSGWLDQNSQQQVQQTLEHMDNTWVSQRNERSECDAPQQRIDPYGIAHPNSKPEGDINGTMYKRNSDGSLWKRDGVDNRVTSFSRSAGQFEQLQSSSDDTLRTRQESHMFNLPSVPNAHITKTHQETSQQVQDNSKLDYVQRMLSSNKDENEGIGERQRQMSNSSHIIQNSFGRDEKTYEQQSCFQKDNSYDCKPVDISATIGRSVGSGGVHLTAATSQNMLELLNKVDRLKENTSVAQFEPCGFNPLSEMTDAKPPVASVNQMYNQSSASASQGFALKLAPPSQRQSNSNSQFSPQGLLQTARQMHSDLGEKNQAYSAASPPSQSLSRSHESSPRGRWDDKFSIGGQSSISQSYVQGGSIAEITSSPTFRRNQLQTQGFFNPHASGPSAQATLPASATGHPHSNLAQSEDSSQRSFFNADGQQFPILECVPVSHPAFMSGMSPQGGVPFRPHNLWTDKASLQHVSGMEPQQVPTVVHSNDSVETTPSTLKEINCLNSQQGGGHLQGFSSPEEKHVKERGQRPMFTGMLEASQTGVRNVSDPGGLPLLTNSNLQDPDRRHNGDNIDLSRTARNLQLIGHALNPSHGFRQNYSLLHQMQAMKNMVTDPSGRGLDVRQATVMAGQSVYDHNKDTEVSTASHLKSLPQGNNNGPNLLSEAREDSSMKASPQSGLQAQGMAAFGETDSQSQYTGSNGTPIHAEASRANLFMAENWFKQYGNFRNEQVPLMQDARTAVGQFSLIRPSHSLNIHSSVDQIDASDSNQGSKVWPGTAANFVPNEPLIAPCGLNSNVSNQSTDILRPKKRKIAICDQPWYKVAQGSKEVQDFSLAEEDWALASNRLIEKVPDDFGMFEDIPPMFRAKRRLIFTTQFMQHLFSPAPSSFLSANAALHYDSVTYFVAMLSVGDACSVTCSKRNNTLKKLNNSDMILDKPKVSESTDDQFFSKVVGDLTDRSKKLENELLRLDRAASILDVRLECQELERFSVINRFAKFHLPRADMSGTAAASGTFTNASRPCPQRYVTGQPLPKNLPEEVQCLSL